MFILWPCFIRLYIFSLSYFSTVIIFMSSAGSTKIDWIKKIDFILLISYPLPSLEYFFSSSVPFHLQN